MIKTLILTLICINCFPLISQNTSIEVLYSIKLNNVTEDLKNKDLTKAFENRKFKLIMVNNESLFSSYEILNTNETISDKIAKTYLGSNNIY